MQFLVFAAFCCFAATSVLGQECDLIVNLWYPEGTYNEASELIVPTPEECCSACQDDSKCVAWSWNELRSACGLKDGTKLRYANAEYRSQLYDVGNIKTPKEEFRYPVDMKILHIEYTIDICEGEQNVIRENSGFTSVRVMTPKYVCCDTCRKDPECFSWSWDSSTYNCLQGPKSGNAVAKEGWWSESVV